MKAKRLAALALAGVLTVSIMAGCGVDKSATIATYNDKEVTMGIANFYVKFQQASMEDAYKSYLQTEDVWNSDLYNSGSTMGQNVKSSVMTSLHEMYTLRDHMDEYNVSLTEDEKAKITSVVEQFMKDNTKEALNEMGATNEIVEELLTLYTIQQKMHAAMIADVDTNVSDEEANMRGITLVTISKAGHSDENYNYTAYTDEEKAQLTLKANEMVAKCKNPADLEKLCEEYGFTANASTYDADDTSMDENLKAQLDKLSVGEMTDVVENDNFLYIARVDKETDEEATEKNRASIVQGRQDDAYNEKLQGWQKDDNWKVDDKKLAKISFKNHLTQKSTEASEEVSTEK